MKNLMTYINPLREFTEEYAGLVKVQIDNSIRTWDKKDILLVTNFPYSYGGVDSIVVPDNLFCDHHMRASKINVICYMIDNSFLYYIFFFFLFFVFLWVFFEVQFA